MVQYMSQTPSPGMMMVPSMVVFTLLWIMVGAFLCYLVVVAVMLLINRIKHRGMCESVAAQPHDDCEDYWQGYRELQSDSVPYPENEDRQAPPAEMLMMR